MKTQEIDMTAPGSFAADQAERLIAAERAAIERSAREETTAATLRHLAQTTGLVFLQRLEAALRAGVGAFNARLGRPLLAVRLGENGAISVASLDDVHRYVLFMPELDVDPPGLTVTVVNDRGRQRIPFDFLVEDASLKLFCGDRGAIGPEGFAGLVLGPWLSALPLRGR